jgi:hypothetical protein
VQFQTDQDLRLLDAVELLRTIQFFMQRLKQGDSARTLSIGLDCLDTMCLEMLQRMQRSWGQVLRRQYSRIQRGGPAFVCAGIPALHFFASGQKPFAPPVVEALMAYPTTDLFYRRTLRRMFREVNQDEDFIALDEPTEKILPSPVAGEFLRARFSGSSGSGWQIKVAQGLQLVRHGNSRTYVRGDVIGIQRWRSDAGVLACSLDEKPSCRWARNGRRTSGLRCRAGCGGAGSSCERREYQPAALPAVEVLRGQTLLCRAVSLRGTNLWLAEGKGVRTVRY